MNKKTEQLSTGSVEKNTTSPKVEDYPTRKVMLMYSLLGGGTGGLLILLAKAFKIVGWGRVEIEDIFSLFVVGTIVGFPPALITGVLVALCKIVINNPFNYLPIAYIGLMSSFFYSFVFMPEITYDESLLFLFWAVGTGSAVILAFFVVPKRKE